MPAKTPTQIPSQQRLHLTQDGVWKPCRAKTEATCRVKSGQHRSTPEDSIVAAARRQAESEGAAMMAKLEATYSPEQVFDARYDAALSYSLRRFDNAGGFVFRCTWTEDFLTVFRAEFPKLVQAGQVTEADVERVRNRLYILGAAHGSEEIQYYRADEARKETRHILENALEIEQSLDRTFGPGERAYDIAMDLPTKRPDPFAEYAKFAREYYARPEYAAWQRSLGR